MSNPRETMSLRRSAALSLALTALAASASCEFEDPNAPPPPDECVKKSKGPAEAGLWAIVDGPPACSTTNPARPEGDDTLIYYSGGGWNAESAHCRALDIFLGATPITDPDLDMDGKPDVTIERNFEVPLDAIGYCLINEGTPSEITAYSTCGIQSAGQGACEQTLVQAPKANDITAQWFNCPGGPLCAPQSDDGCLAEAGDGKSYAAFVDDPDFFCAGTKQEGTLSDAEDTLMVMTGTRFKASSALCVAAGPYNKTGVPTYGVGPLSRLAVRDMATNLPVLDPAKNPVPNGIADGYCLFNKGLAEEFVLYSMCSGLAPVEPVDAGPVADGGTPAKPVTPPVVLTRKERCAGFKEEMTADGGTTRTSVWGTKVPSPRAGEWVDCPGGPLCNLPLKMVPP